MHVLINVKSPNNTISKWQMGFNSAFKGLKEEEFPLELQVGHLNHQLRCPQVRVEKHESPEIKRWKSVIPGLNHNRYGSNFLPHEEH
jgi:hypothetical protein